MNSFKSDLPFLAHLDKQLSELPHAYHFYFHKVLNIWQLTDGKAGTMSPKIQKDNFTFVIPQV